MKSILGDIIPGGEVAYNTDIVEVSLPSAGCGDFELLLSVWPDLWGFQGPAARVSISASGARLLEEISKDEIDGYELRNILVDEDAKRLDIFVTLRILKIRYEDYTIRKL